MNNKINAELADALNPNMLFNSTATELLVKIASGELNAQDLAKQQLEGRGLNNKGEWVGFNK